MFHFYFRSNGVEKVPELVAFFKDGKGSKVELGKEIIMKIV
ncbi:hypothetical protein OSCI_3370026 [Kamptonema sp. PCC 6506]|nr:hypothetical protein OSCI_3370026 [Kamptonema sp. PCC 6506]